MFTRVLVLIVLQMGLSHCFTWDIVVGGKTQLEFYNNGTLTHTEDVIQCETVRSLIYDPVHYRVLFAYHYKSYMSISSFDLSTRTTLPLYTGISDLSSYESSLAYDPITQLLFLGLGNSLYSFSLKAEFPNKEVDAKILLTLKYYNCRNIAVDSCGGYIYWITDEEIERVRFDGSEREVLIVGDFYLRPGLAIDQWTQKMYWAEYNNNQVSIETADLNGESRRTLHSIAYAKHTVGVLTISKDFIYGKNLFGSTVWQFTKIPPHYVKPILSSTSDIGMAANYTIEEQTQGTKTCEALKSLTSNSASAPNTADVALLCLHGKKFSGESRCECTQDYTGERCEVSICQNYCFQGDCRVSAEGEPKCRCKAGYSGERCEVNACHKYCLNSGVCSLNETYEPVCQCAQDYVGDRCDVPIVLINCIQTVSTWREMLHADITPISLRNGVKSTCASTVL